MAQTHIINQLRPWRIFFDTYGHLHLHAASVLCIDDHSGNQEQHYSKKVDFHTYPMDPIGSVFAEAEIHENGCIFDIHEGEPLTILSDKFADSYDILREEASLEISHEDFINDLEKCGVILLEDKVVSTLEVHFYCDEDSYVDDEDSYVDDKILNKSAVYQCISNNFFIIKGYDSPIMSFDKFRADYLKYVKDELQLYREYAPNLKLVFKDCSKNDNEPFINEIQSLFDDFNSSMNL